MFGYVKTDLPNMYVKDTVLYKAAYCGLCKGIGKTCGQAGRFALSYDLTFLSVLLHNVCNVDMVIEKERCVLHRIKKRPIASYDDLTGRVAFLNIIFAYYKLSDDVIDANKGRAKRSFIKKAYSKAKKAEPKLDAIVDEKYKLLRQFEKDNSDSIDMVSDCFGKMLSETVEVLAEEHCTEELKELAYNLGKYIYLIDALDDFDKDIKKGQFNVLHNAFNDSNSKEELLEKHSKDIAFIFGNVFEIISERAKNLKYNFNHDLTDNILFNGLYTTLKQITENKKCKKITKS